MQGEPLNVAWKRGEFHTFYALMKIRIGGANENALQQGDEFEYDGSILKYAGAEFPAASLRGAFRSGWVSDQPLDDNGAYVPPKQATRNVAKSQSVNRDLSNVQRQGARQMSADNLDEDTVLNVSDRSAVRQANGRGHLTADNNRRQASARGMRIETDEVEAQEAVEIGRIRTSTHLKANVLDSRSAGIKDRLENLSGSGFIRDRNAPIEERQSTGKVIHREGVTIKTSVGNINRSVRAEADDEGVDVGRVRHTDRRQGSSEGVSVRDTSNIRGQKAAPAAAPKATYKVNTKLNPKVRIARSIDPDFPEDWSFEGRLNDRLSAVKAHGATPEFLEALYAAEGDQMRKLLEKTYPKQFGK